MPADRRFVVARGRIVDLDLGSGYDRPSGLRAGWRRFHGSLDVEFVAKVSHDAQTSARASTYRSSTSRVEMLSCLDLGTMASEDLCGEGGHSSGRLPEAS